MVDVTEYVETIDDAYVSDDEYNRKPVKALIDFFDRIARM